MATEPSARVIADSITVNGDRLTTVEVVHHRFVLAEENTHREFSRNSASSRAIPVHKQIEKIVNDPALPVCYMYNQPGMQAADYMSEEDAAYAEKIIRDMALIVADGVKKLNGIGPIDRNTHKPLGLHKQWANRYLEPWMWHTAIISSTGWSNFFAQRVSKFSVGAQPEMRAVADAIAEAIDASQPRILAYGQWHTPYIQPYELDPSDRRFIPEEDRVKISAARCARVSYLTHDGLRDLSADFQLFDRLTTALPPHWSPLEHVATPLRYGETALGNFTGWAQLRHCLPTRRGYTDDAMLREMLNS